MSKDQEWTLVTGKKKSQPKKQSPKQPLYQNSGAQKTVKPVLSKTKEQTSNPLSSSKPKPLVQQPSLTKSSTQALTQSPQAPKKENTGVLDYSKLFIQKPGETSTSTTKALPKQPLPKPPEEEDNTVLFGQQAVGKWFGEYGKFGGSSVKMVAQELRLKQLSPDDLPIEYIERDGEKITLNNRSLTALTLAGLKPTKLVNKTGNKFLEQQLSLRLSEMGGKPSKTMPIRYTDTVAVIK